ncbi:MAG: alpha/beta fold hydrolase [Miltoncostaeaceae bacterium]
MSAPSVLFLHGSGGRPDVWAMQLARFEGSSALWLTDPADGPFPTTVGAAAERVHPVLAAVPPPRVLVGHSLGGAVALDVALSAPELVDGLVLITSGARLPVPDEAIERARNDIDAEARRLVTEAYTDTDSPLVERSRQAIVEGGSEALTAAYLACRAHDMRGRLGGVSAPALLVAGGRDPRTPPWLSAELARELPNAHLVMIAAGSHMVITENAGQLNLLLAGFLARLELTLSDL